MSIDTIRTDICIHTGIQLPAYRIVTCLITGGCMGVYRNEAWRMGSRYVRCGVK